MFKEPSNGFDYSDKTDPTLSWHLKKEALQSVNACIPSIAFSMQQTQVPTNSSDIHIWLNNQCGTYSYCKSRYLQGDQ